MKPLLQMRLGPQLTMTPQLQNAIRLLQLSKLELNLEIQAAVESNLMLELSEDAATVDDLQTSTDDADLAQHPDNIPTDLPIDTNWEDIYPDNTSLFNNNAREQVNFDLLQNNDLTLQAHLAWQLNLTPFSDQDRIIATAIIDSISDSGYLTCTLEDLHESLANTAYELELAEVEAVLHRIQQFDPLGVGSRNLQECLTTQLKILPNTTPFLSEAKQLVATNLELLGQKNYTRLKNRLKLTDATLQGVIDLLTQLNPRPGMMISVGKVDFIIPDVIVVKKNGAWVIELNKDYIPKVRINAGYTSMIKRADPSRENKFLQEQLKEAKWFLKSLQNRNETLLKVTTCIVEQQRAFLEYGEEAMQPLILQDIATNVGLHESTISRITTQKYLHTPRGIYELKSFFSSHVTSETGKRYSSTAIQALIRKLVTQEQLHNPLSDHGIAQLLTSQGINVARRTVAKYRESLAIPPSNQRKNLNRKGVNYAN